MFGAVMRLIARYGLLALGLLFAAMAQASWMAGSPPNWSLFAPRDVAEVVSAGVASGRAGNGSLRHWPDVEIRWPAGTGETMPLEGLQPSFFAYGPSEAERLASAYPVGLLVPVRILDGRPMADRIDLLGLAHALFMSVFAFCLLIAGGFAVWLVGRIQAMR